MATFQISTKDATESYTDGIPFITLKYGRGHENYNVRVFEAKNLDQIKAEVVEQEKMAVRPSVTQVKKVEGRAPGGFNTWNACLHFFDPAEEVATA